MISNIFVRTLRKERAFMNLPQNWNETSTVALGLNASQAIRTITENEKGSKLWEDKHIRSCAVMRALIFGNK